MITCGVCGAANEAEAIFCGVCGNRLPQAEAHADERGDGSAGPAATDDAVVPSQGAALAAAPAPGDVSPTEVVATPSLAAVPSAPEPDDGKVACSVCGTRNDPARSFCRKCANPLHPGTPVNPNAGWAKRFALTFVPSAAIGVAVVLVGAALLQPPPATAAPPIAAISRDGDHVGFGLTPAAPKALPTLPATSTIQLTSFKEAGATSPPGSLVQPPWWNATVPRVPAVTQFDGGPLAAVNCVMASGAMLARLGYGIVTTGSQLRALQDNQAGATNYEDLQTAVSRGWGVKFFRGDLTALQFRALLWAGAGVEIGIVYGALPVADRLQESFTGNHSIYVDAFRPAGPDGPAAYYVMDPIGHTWAGYRGSWLPAGDIEAAAYAHSNGVISATWVFAGGVVPADHRVLPPEDYPGAVPGATPAPSGSGGPFVDPMPLGDLPQPVDPPTGTPPPVVPTFPHPQFVTDAFVMDPSAGLPYCSVLPAPAGCPTGILGIIGVQGTVATGTSPPNSNITMLYADEIAPGTYQIVFESPPTTTNDVWFWATSGTTSTLEQASVEAGYIGVQAVSIATITLDPTASYSFVASASGDGVRSVSSVGTLSVGP